MLKQVDIKKATKPVRFFQTITLLCLVFVSIGSLSPGSPDFPPFSGSDKLLHLIAYAGLSLLTSLATIDRRRILPFALILIAWGVALEGAQSIVPGRFPSFWDIVANTSGVALGTLTGLLLRNRLPAYRARPQTETSSK